MLIASRLSYTTPKFTSHCLFRHSRTALASAGHRTPPASVSNARRKARPTSLSSEEVTKDTIAQIREFLRFESRLQRIEGFIHKCLDKALLWTPRHHHVYEAVIVYLITNMWPQLAATVFDRMLNQGFMTRDVLQARMLVILLADTQGSADPVMQLIADIVSKPTFSDQHFLTVLNVAEDYHVREACVIALIHTFLRGKGTQYTPRREIIAAWLRAAVKLKDMELVKEILELGNATLKLSAIRQAWEVADELDDCLEKLGGRLVGTVANPRTQESEFLRAMKVVKDVGVDEQTVARICASFLANREADYVPIPEVARIAIEAFIHTDKVDKAFALLDRVGIQPDDDDRPLHRTFLANLRDIRPLDHHSFAKLLCGIDAAGIALDTKLLNLLISREVRLGRTANALSLFNDMKKTTGLLPDSYTFGSLFAMYRRIRPRSLKSFSSAATPSYSIRDLYRELMQSCTRVENPVQPNAALLNTALKAFMRQRDYAGAIVILMSYSLFHVPLDNKSYYCVVKLLVRRVWAESLGSRPKNEARWVDRFLGVRHYTEIALGSALVHQMFAVVRRKHFNLSMALYVPKQAPHHRLPRHLRLRTAEDAHYYAFPTMEMMESLVPPPPEPVEFVYDAVPLIRLLSRAVYAELVVGPAKEDEGSRMVEELVKRAEDEIWRDFVPSDSLPAQQGLTNRLEKGE